MVRDKIKDRQNSVRIYDEEGFLQRAACICVKNGAEDEVRDTHLWLNMQYNFLDMNYEWSDLEDNIARRS